MDILELYLDRTLDCVLGVLMCTIAITGVVSNGIMSAHLSMVRSPFRTRTTYMLLQLAVADLLTCLTLAPAVGVGLLNSRILPSQVSGNQTTSHVLANIIGWTSSAMNEASILLVCVLSIDRFVAVFFPLQRTHILTQARFTTLCLLSWTVPISVSVYPLFRSGHYYYLPLLGFYVAEIGYSSPLEELLVFILANVLAVGPFLLTVGFCVAVIVKLARKERGSPGGKSTNSRWWSSSNKVQLSRLVWTKNTEDGPVSPSSTIHQPQNKPFKNDNTPNEPNEPIMQITIQPSDTEIVKVDESNEPIKPITIQPPDTEIVKVDESNEPIKPITTQSPDSEEIVKLDEPTQTVQPRTKRSIPLLSRTVGCKTSDQKQANGNKNRTVMVIIGLYIICLFPGNLLNIYNLLNNFDLLPYKMSLNCIFEFPEMVSMYLYFMIVFHIFFFMLNSCVNPVVYYFRTAHYNCLAIFAALCRC